MVHFIQFVDEQDAGFLVPQGTQQRTGAEELLSMQFSLQRLPIDAAGSRLQLNAKPLQWLVEFPNSLLFVDALIALEPFDACVCSLGNSICECVFPLPAGPSSNNGFFSLAAKYTVVVAIESAM